MIVESMSNAELRTAIEKDLERVRTKANFHLQTIRKVMRKTNMTYFMKYFPYFSPNKNHWIYGIDANPKKSVFHMCVYYYTRQGTTVVQIASDDVLYKFNGHLLERYYERQNRDINSPQQWIINYMEETRAYKGELLETIEPGCYKVFVTVPRGACLGNFLYKEKIFDLKTFITPDLMYPEQLSMYNYAMTSVNEAIQSVKLKK